MLGNLLPFWTTVEVPQYLSQQYFLVRSGLSSGMEVFGSEIDVHCVYY